MKNPFTYHPKRCVNETWFQHCKFTLHVALRLFITAFIFIVHGFFPFIAIPKWLNLEDTIKFLKEENKDRSDKLNGRK
tara:strand:+ start:470 stop:703 length:234 start_codon:yes stop_codon:yes gene_type:complete